MENTIFQIIRIVTKDGNEIITYEYNTQLEAIRGVQKHIRAMMELDKRDKFDMPNKYGKRFKLDEIVAFCQEKCLAFFDTSTAIRRLQDNASDKFLEVVERTDIRALLQQLPHCRAIITTGEKATETICASLQIPEIPKVNSSVAIPELFNNDGLQVWLYRLPSSSRAYPLSFDKKVEAYRSCFAKLIIEN